MIYLNLYIAVDGGGTKTETLLFDGSGHILARDVTTGCNPLDIGSLASAKLLCDAVRGISAAAKGQIGSVFCGVAGNCHSHGALLEYLRAHIDAPSLNVCDDTYNVISSELERADGCGLVAGTGSSLLVRVKGKICRHIGGWGFLIDTGGSGYVLGHDAIYMALRAIDGRGEKTVLTELLGRALGESVDQAMAQIYAGGRSFIASLAHTVFEGRAMGDKVAGEIFDKGVASLAELVSTAAQYFPGEYPVVLGGGLFSVYPEYVAALRQSCPTQTRLISTDMPVVYGAAVEALAAVNMGIDAAFRSTFLSDYHALTAAARQGRAM